MQQQIKQTILIAVLGAIAISGGLSWFWLQGKPEVKEINIVQAQTPKTIWCNPANTGTEDGLTKPSPTPFPAARAMLQV